MTPTTLPTGIPRLDALVREEARQKAAERYNVWRLHAARHGRGPMLHWWLLSDIDRAIDIDTEDGLLRALARPESRDWAVRAGIGYEVAALVTRDGSAEAEAVDKVTRRWDALRGFPAQLALALAEVCRG